MTGRILADGTLDPTVGEEGSGIAWIGSARADGNGRWTLAADLFRPGKRVSVLAIDGTGNTSEFHTSTVIPSSARNLPGSLAPSLPRVAPPPRPSLPTPYQGEVFDCSFADGTLRWTDVGAPEYYVFARDGGGNETYLGGHRTTSISAEAAASYRVSHWRDGFERNTFCDGPADAVFSCSYANGRLTWTDEGAPEYYVFAFVDGEPTYLGGHRGTSLSAIAADRYEVEHWLSGSRTVTECTGGLPAFSCSVTGGTLRWSDTGGRRVLRLRLHQRGRALPRRPPGHVAVGGRGRLVPGRVLDRRRRPQRPVRLQRGRVVAGGRGTADARLDRLRWGPLGRQLGQQRLPAGRRRHELAADPRQRDDGPGRRPHDRRGRRGRRQRADLPLHQRELAPGQRGPDPRLDRRRRGDVGRQPEQLPSTGGPPVAPVGSRSPTT